MFDGLRKKLDRFREDVEETAEEKAADADGEAAVEEPETVEDAEEPAAESSEPDEPGEAATTEREPEPEPAEPDGEEPADAESVATTDPDDAAADTASVDADAVPDDADEEAAGSLAAENVKERVAERAEERAGPSRLQRAKAFATGKIILEAEDLEDPLWQLEMALLESDVEMSVAEEILDTIRDHLVGEAKAQYASTSEMVADALRDALLDVVSVGQFDFDESVRDAEKPVVIIFTGVNGVGKTTSIAKVSEYLEARGLTSVLANGDTYRAGANEQLREHAEALDRKLISHEKGGDPAAVIYDAVEYAEAHDIDVVLGDTAGRLHTSKDLMAQLEKIDRVVDPDLTVFVDEAVAGQDAVERAKQFDDAAEIDGSILTKADADASGGAAISIAYVTGKPILFLGTGQGYADLERFEPEWLVEQLLGEA